MVNRIKSRILMFLARIVAGEEPVAVVWLVSVVAAVAAKYGLDLDAEVIWTFLAISFPAMATARNKVDPSDSRVSWREVIRSALNPVEADIEIDPEGDNLGPAGEVVEYDLDEADQPLWLEEHFPEYAYAGEEGD